MFERKLIFGIGGQFGNLVGGGDGGEEGVQPNLCGGGGGGGPCLQ